MEFPPSVRLLALLLLAIGLGVLFVARNQPHVVTLPARSDTLQATPPPPTATPRPTPLPQSIRDGVVSPYEISRYLKEHRDDPVFSMAGFWQRLGIDGADGNWQRCEVKLFHLPLDKEPGNEVMLRLYSWGNCRYLIFKPMMNNWRRLWKFLGVIDKRQDNPPMPHRLVSTASQRWLVVTYEADRGSAFGLEYQDWYTVTSTGITTVLRYPSGRYFSGWGSGLAAKSDSTLLNVQEQAVIATISLRFTISYSTYVWENGEDKTIKLWRRNQSVSFTQLPNSKKFVLDQAHSQLTKREMNALYDGLFTACDDVLRYNYPQLARLTKEKPLAVKAWLKKYLNDCSDSPKRRALLRRLRKVRSTLDEQ